MPWHPEAVRKEIAKHRRAIVGPRRLIFHTAVANASSLKGYFDTVSDCSHWYTQRDGGIEQYVDTQFQAPANRDANHDSLSVESWDGYGATWHQGDPVPAWTQAQVEANARIAAWCHLEHGIPLELIPDSKPGREGIGYHRLGVDPWRVAGGELWSSARGKVCPGDARIAQVPEIIERAKELVGMAFTADEERMLKGIVEQITAKGSNAGLFGPLIDAIREGILTKDNHNHGAVGGTVDAELRAAFNSHKHAEGTTAEPRDADKI